MATDEFNTGFNAGTIAALAVVRAMDCGVTWREIVEAAGTHQVLVHALTNEGDWEWGGFDHYAKRELPVSAVKKARAEARRLKAKALRAAEKEHQP